MEADQVEGVHAASKPPSKVKQVMGKVMHHKAKGPYDSSKPTWLQCTESRWRCQAVHARRNCCSNSSSSSRCRHQPGLNALPSLAV